MPPWAVPPAGYPLNPTLSRGPEGVKCAAERGFPGRTELALCLSGAASRRWGHAGAQAPTQCARTGPSWPPGQQDPREPRHACRDTGDLQPLPGTTRMALGGPRPCSGMGSFGREPSCPLLGDTGGWEAGHRSLLILPGKMSVSGGLAGALGSGRDCDVVAVAANLGCDRARAPVEPTPPSLAPRHTWSCCGGSAPHKAPSSMRHLPCECGPGLSQMGQMGPWGDRGSCVPLQGLPWGTPQPWEPWLKGWGGCRTEEAQGTWVAVTAPVEGACA